MFSGERSDFVFCIDIFFFCERENGRKFFYIRSLLLLIFIYIYISLGIRVEILIF